MTLSFTSGKKLKDKQVFPISDDNAAEFMNPVTRFSLYMNLQYGNEVLKLLDVLFKEGQG